MTRYGLGLTLTKLERFSEAEPLLLASYKRLARHAAAPPAYMPALLDALVELYED